MAKRKQNAPLSQVEPEGTQESETAEPESGAPLAKDHAREVAEALETDAEPEQDTDVAGDDGEPLPEELQTLPGITLRKDTVTCKRCGNTYAMDAADDFTCTDRRCPITEEMYP